jgi:hypothetical protein
MRDRATAALAAAYVWAHPCGRVKLTPALLGRLSSARPQKLKTPKTPERRCVLNQRRNEVLTVISTLCLPLQDLVLRGLPLPHFTHLPRGLHHAAMAFCVDHRGALNCAKGVRLSCACPCKPPIATPACPHLAWFDSLRLLPNGHFSSRKDIPRMSHTIRHVFESVRRPLCTKRPESLPVHRRLEKGHCKGLRGRAVYSWGAVLGLERRQPRPKPKTHSRYHALPALPRQLAHLPDHPPSRRDFRERPRHSSAQGAYRPPHPLLRAPSFDRTLKGTWRRFGAPRPHRASTMAAGDRQMHERLRGSAGFHGVALPRVVGGRC